MEESKQQTQTVQREQTPEERELTKIQLRRAQASEEDILALDRAGLAITGKLLRGDEDLPGFLGGLEEGIDPETLGITAAEMARRAGSQFQNLGIAESGVAFEETARSIGRDLLFPAEQFNIGNRFNLLNLGVGGQAQIQQPILGSSAQLSGRLEGLRTVTQTGVTTGPSAFNTALMTGLGQGVAAAPFALAGGAKGPLSNLSNVLG